MEAGRRLFATRGFDGTSIRALTQAAEVNLGAVTYHFETKEALYHAVLERVLGPVRDGLRRLMVAPLPPSERLTLFIHAMFQYQRHNQDIPRFMAQEIVLGEHPSPPVLETVKTLVGGLAGIIEEGQKDGTVGEGDPVLMALIILAQPIYLSVMLRFLSRDDLLSAELPKPEGSPEEHVAETIRRAFFTGQEKTE